MYDQLNDASLSTSRQLAGYITLLQCWIYEHFLSVAECNADPDYNKVASHACRWIATKKIVKKVSIATYRQRLDRLRIPDVCWMPYSKHQPVQDFHPIFCFSGQLCWGPVVVRYRLERVMRQFGYVECIPAHPVHPWVSYDDVDDTWMHYSDHLAEADPSADAPTAQPRHVPQVPESDIPQVPDDPARSDVDEPRHTMEACDAMVERLECHLSLGVVMPGTSTHEVIEECLKIAKSVTQDRIVYVRSRRRRRIVQL
ncbi:protein MAINTENANCE OF MERISTEMS-like [Glycine soja]|uniref:protein MAINTENANCE OF MERISTEMS-like n=1 Tax=Glycine soja TaxID=3848 RepID=UPI00103B050A|nr:protein MAINTENANCE OF MERISTEMS-like [Glycine soja]